MEAPASGPVLQPPDKFQFPFPPYDIQEDFMKSLFNCLEQGKLGIFESPTGTGKSLSLICGGLTWFLESERRRRQDLELLVGDKTRDAEDDGDDWFAAAGRRQEYNQKRLVAKEELERIVKREERMAGIKARRNKLQQTEVEQNKDEFNDLFKEMQWMKKAVARELSQGPGDEDILVEEYVSDEEQEDKPEEEEDTSRRIFFCSRTHSQLSQFVREVKKSPFGESVSLVSLASRAIMCVNPTVKGLQSQAAINERCLELGRKKSSKLVDEDHEPARKRAKKGEGVTCGCPYNRAGATAALKEQAVLAIHDIEELVAAGRKNQACPYYASRSAVPLAQVVVLPYNTLLHAATRAAVGLNLKNSIVIIDEAHNLLETISNIHSVGVGGGQLCLAYSQLSQYREKYSSRLKARNLLYIKQLIFILSKLIKSLGGSPGRDPGELLLGQKEETKLLQVTDFLVQTEIYNLQLLKLVKYCNVSQICHKLNGFVERYKPSQAPLDGAVKTGVAAFVDSLKAAKEPAKEVQEEVKENKTPTSPLQGVVELLASLSLTQGEARVVLTRSSKLSGARLRFLLLDPAQQFREIVTSAHSVVVAGGTMRPQEEFRDQLFLASGAPLSRVATFSCDHVVPGSNLLPIVLPRGPSGHQLDFSFQHRGLDSTLDELGRALLNIVTMVPGGVVVFFPSYDYEKTVHTRLTTTGLLARLEAKKRIYREPKNTADLDKVLADYATSVRLAGGALLLAVVGGKMSEGINFSDDLGRAVVMVGLPYPNLHSPELKEKMAHLNRTVTTVDGKPAGQVHYENLCMKAVNQSVGRAIRHKDDYAAILLLDHRFSKPAIISQLPGWISRHLRVAEKFGPVLPSIRTFFKGKQNK